MSLLDDVSIVVTPNGYKAGELYAVVPVPVEGAELVTSWANNDFSSFASSGSNITQMVSSGSGNNNYSLATITSGKLYKLEFTSSQAITCQIRTSTNINLTGATVVLSSLVLGLNEIYFTTSSDYTYIGFYAPNSFTDTQISGFTLKEETKADMDVTRATAATRVDEAGLVNYAEIIGSEEVTNGDFASDLTGWTGYGITSATGGVATIGASANSGIFQTILTQGVTYTATVNVTSYDGVGTAQFINNNGTNIYTITETGIQTFTFIHSIADATLLLRGISNALFSVSSVSVKEVTRDNVPRIDYSGGGCPHILAEPQRTNVIEYSEDFSNSYWAKSNANVESNAAVSPDGTQNADKLNFTTSSGEIVKGMAFVSGQTYTMSFYAKTESGTLDFIYGNMDYFTISGTATDEWQRFVITQTLPTTTRFPKIQTTEIGSLLLWGWQVEQGSYATSYIPTSGSTVTRNQDIFSRDGIGSLINSEEGVLFVEMAKFQDATNFGGFELNDGTSSNSVSVYTRNASSSVTVIIRKSGTQEWRLDYNTGVNTYDFNSYAIRFSDNNFSLWVNGSKAGEQLSGSTPLSLSNLTLSAFWGGTFYGKVKQLQVYKTALTDEQLIQLTGESGTDFYESYAEMASALTYTIQ